MKGKTTLNISYEEMLDMAQLYVDKLMCFDKHHRVLYVKQTKSGRCAIEIEGEAKKTEVKSEALAAVGLVEEPGR